MDFDLRLAIGCTEHFAAASGLGCVLAGKEGKVLHECGENYLSCEICPLAELDKERGLAMHRWGLRAAERFGGKYIYACPMGLTFFTSPILGPKGAEAQITAGPFLMGEMSDWLAYDLDRVRSEHPEKIHDIIAQVRKYPCVEAQKVTSLAELLFMAVAFMNNVSEANRMLETEKSMRIQGQISDYLFRIKQNAAGEVYPYREEKNFLQALRRGDGEQARRLLGELMGHILLETGSDMIQVRERVFELTVLMSRSLLDTGCDPVHISRFMHECRERIPDMGTMEEVTMWLTREIASITDTVTSPSRAHHSDLVYRTVRYLQETFMRNTPLEEIARAVYASPTYLSRVFKQETGISVVDSLNRIRVEKSRELLGNTNVSLVSVALQSGFESQSYFTHVFRQNCGMTPLQYRKRAKTAGAV